MPNREPAHLIVPAMIGAFLGGLVLVGLGHAGWGVVAVACSALGLGVFAVQAMTRLSKQGREARSQAELLERRVLEQREAVDALADGLDAAIFLCDGRGVIEFANRRAVEMFRFDAPVGKQILAVTLSHELEQLVTETAGSAEPRRAELTFGYPEDRVALVQAWGEPPEYERVFLSIVDITELRRLERIRQDFVANVSHEVRTPMTTIRAMSETLLDDDTGDEDLKRRYLERIITEVDRLTLISQDLLVLSTAESGVVRKQACDFAAVVKGVIAMLGDKAKKKQLKLRYSGPKHLWIEANPAQMSQVFVNLIDNAINYTTNGGVEVSVVPEGDEVVCTVTDTGCGIAAEHLPRIFERFYRVDKARSRATGGTGLGLSIVRHIVESHGGRVSVESELDLGTTFTVRLPVGSLDDEGS